MNQVRITFDTLAQRWEIARVGDAGRWPLQPEDEHFEAARNVAGEIVEIVIDVESTSHPDADALAKVADAFGSSVIDALAMVDPISDIDVTVTAPTRRELAKSAAPTLPGEPGVLIRRGEGHYDLSLERGTAHVAIDSAGISVTVPGVESPGWWVRISDSDSGSLLAMGPIEPHPPDPAPNVDTSAKRASHLTHQVGTATMSFGLDVDDTIFTVTTDPLDRVPPRAQRRAAWIDGLLTDAERRSLGHPREARRTARRAADIAALLGDDGRRRRADDIEQRARRWQKLRMVAVAGLVAAVAAAAWWLLARDDTNTELPTVPIDVTSTALVAEPTTVEDGTQATPVTFGGPSSYVLDERSTLDVRLIGSTRQAAGQPLTLSATETLLIPDAVFGPAEPANQDAATEEAARNVCLSATDVPASATNFDPPADTEIFVTLTSLDRDESVFIGTVTSSSPIERFSVDPADCRSARLGDDGLFRAPNRAIRQTQNLVIALPDGLTSGTWAVEFATSAATATVEGFIVITVD